MPLPAILPPLYAITDLAASGAPSHADLTRRLVDGGARLVQLREKSLPDCILWRDVAGSVRIARESGAALIVNDRADLALLSAAHGVHLGEEDLPAEAARALLGPEAVIGVSTHSLEQALRAAAGPVDYIAIGPIYPSTTKLSTRTPLGPQVVARLRREILLPIVAIGGITLERAPEVLGAGADSIAVISELYGGGDLAVRLSRFLTVCGSPLFHRP